MLGVTGVSTLKRCHPGPRSRSGISCRKLAEVPARSSRSGRDDGFWVGFLSGSVLVILPAHQTAHEIVLATSE
jgi:hypothetical protein